MSWSSDLQLTVPLCTPSTRLGERALGTESAAYLSSTDGFPDPVSSTDSLGLRDTQAGTHLRGTTARKEGEIVHTGHSERQPQATAELEV